MIKIREVIGTGGKVIREIVEKTGAKIDIQDTGTIKIDARRVLAEFGPGLVEGLGHLVEDVGAAVPRLVEGCRSRPTRSGK
jgi:hypothetical protein